MRLIWWSPWLLHVLIFLIASQSKKLKCLFTYQAAVNHAWFDKDDYKDVIATHAKAGLFEDRGGFWKLDHKLLKPFGDKVASKHCRTKNNYLSNNYVSNFSKCTNLGIQFHDKRIPRSWNTYASRKKDAMFLFLYNVSGLHFPDAIKQ